MARIEYPDLSSLESEVREFLVDRPLINVFRMWLHAPTVFRTVATLGAYQFSSLELSPRSRELLILMVSQTFEAPYVWDQHVPISEVCGVTEAERESLLCGPPALEAFSEKDIAYLAFVQAVATAPQVADDVLMAVRAHLSDREVVEVVGLVGYYFMLGRMATVLDVESDPLTGGEVLEAALKIK